MKLAAYRKGQNPYNGPYSPDFDESKVQGLSRDAYYPGRQPNKYDLGPPSGNRHDFNAIDCSGTIDPQVPDAQGFDDGKGKGGWLRSKSDDGRGGFSGDVLPGGRPRPSNHPTRTSKNAR